MAEADGVVKRGEGKKKEPKESRPKRKSNHKQKEDSQMHMPVHVSRISGAYYVSTSVLER